MSEFRCTISFAGEAFESAAHHYRKMERCVVAVKPTGGPAFDAVVGELTVNEFDGQYKCVFVPTDEHGEVIDGAKMHLLDIYDDVESILVY